MATRPSRSLPWIRPERNSSVSMQAQIAQWLEQLIGAGRLGAGDRLPSEATLVERLGVSRVTVRLAIDDLVSRGFVARAHGKGSFVTSPVVQHDILSDQPFFDIVLAKAPKAEVRLLAFAPAVPPAKIATLFKLASGRPAMKLERLSLSAGRPVVFSESWLTPDAAHLSPVDIENMSTAAVHSLLLRQPIASSTNAIGAELAGVTVARRLGSRRAQCRAGADPYALRRARSGARAQSLHGRSVGLRVHVLGQGRRAHGRHGAGRRGLREISMRWMKLLAILLSSLSVSASNVAAQSNPSKNISLVVPFAPGGGHDSMARILGGPLSEAARTDGDRREQTRRQRHGGRRLLSSAPSPTARRSCSPRRPRS